MPSIDLALIACFALSCLFCDKRDSLLCLFALLLSIFAFLSPANSSYTHLIICVIYSVCILLVSIRLKRVMMLICLFQYIMAIDAYIYPQTATFLYIVYPYVAFALNLLLLGSLGKGNGIDAIKTVRFFGFLRRRSAIIMRVGKY